MTTIGASRFVWSVLIPAAVAAGVSGLVVLLIEYAAKPSLEARKERILAAHRNLRELCARLELIIEHEREGRFPTRPPEAKDDWKREWSEEWALTSNEGEEARALLLRCHAYLPQEVFTLADYGLRVWKSLLAMPWMPHEFDEYLRLKDYLLWGADGVIGYVALPRWRLRRRKMLRTWARERYRQRSDVPQAEPVDA